MRSRGARRDLWPPAHRALCRGPLRLLGLFWSTQAAFLMFDADGSGALDVEEFKTMMRVLRSRTRQASPPPPPPCRLPPVPLVWARQTSPSP